MTSRATCIPRVIRRVDRPEDVTASIAVCATVWRIVVRAMYTTKEFTDALWQSVRDDCQSP